jgi:hypothetical protein
VFKYSYLSPLIYICYAFSLCYFVLFYFLLCFLCFAGLWKKMKYFWKIGLKEQKEEKLESEEAIVCRRRRSTAVRSNAPRAIEYTNGDRTHQGRSNAPVREAHSSRSPVLEVFDSKALANPCCTRIQPYTF